jgi:hypothetical protein
MPPDSHKASGYEGEYSDNYADSQRKESEFTELPAGYLYPFQRHKDQARTEYVKSQP